MAEGDNFNRHYTIVEDMLQAGIKSGAAFITRMNYQFDGTPNEKAYWVVETLDTVLASFPQLTATAGPVVWRTYNLATGDFSIAAFGDQHPTPSPMNFTKLGINDQIIIREVDAADVTLFNTTENIIVIPASNSAGNNAVGGVATAEGVFSILPPNSVFLFEAENLGDIPSFMQGTYLHITEDISASPFVPPIYVPA